jgi:hypothetical protein
MINQRYASLERCIGLGYGSNADEVCQNLIGKVDEIDLGEASHDEPAIWHRIRITDARLQHHPDSMYPEYIHVDAEEV